MYYIDQVDTAYVVIRKVYPDETLAWQSAFDGQIFSYGLAVSEDEQYLYYFKAASFQIILVQIDANTGANTWVKQS